MLDNNGPVPNVLLVEHEDHPANHASLERHEAPRPRVAGKFIYLGAEKFWVRGVTYGTFRAGASGDDYPASETLERDFALMSAKGINTVRCYTPPPRRLLDAAFRHGLKVIIGLPWEQHVAFLEDPKRADDIVSRVREGVRGCAQHPSVFCYAIGNEIPPSIVRWHGRRSIERFLERLYRAAKEEDPEGLVTYVNFPTTEYLQLPFLDFICFNVYLEAKDRLESYLDRLQSLAGEKPLLMAEIGLDSRRNGLDRQAESLDWQIRTAFSAGCAGAVVFAWTDEWHRGGHDIVDWDFGLVTRDRLPKPALAAVQKAFLETPFQPSIRWPKISVVVCSYNGARTIRDTLEGLKRLEYPNYEVIVVNDGSKDPTPDIAADYDVRLISTENRGLSAARNTGWEQATGEIVAYTDDDAWPDPHWLHFIASRFMSENLVGVGGPNIAPPGDGRIADCVANAPGRPVQVLVSDREAEHIPGCNMAFRKEALAAIGGFDVRYRAAGDDVDICWRLNQAGGKIGFHAGAMVWHHCRNSLLTYWRQQQGYGKAEALLEEKWPEYYNPVGHLVWKGRLYGRGFTLPLPLGRSRVYGGVWGSLGYQSLYEPGPSTLLSLPIMPEWYFAILALAVLTFLGLSWPPLLWMSLPLLAATAAPLAQAGLAASRARYPVPAPSIFILAERWALTFFMHMAQPVARLIGRLRHGLTPWRRRGPAGEVAQTKWTLWSEKWRPPEEWIERLETAARQDGGVTRRGGDFDDWDLEFTGGLLGSARMKMAVEEHGAGNQLVRAKVSPFVGAWPAVTLACIVAMTFMALRDSAYFAALILGGSAVIFSRALLRDLRSSKNAFARAVEILGRVDGFPQGFDLGYTNRSFSDS